MSILDTERDYDEEIKLALIHTYKHLICSDLENK